ncbi:hypothetical protein L207DRAFT_508816 [Hyaloscypha variabilis F]|jgi:hypothetical protein|uniref:FHA domain-containing protein n=1 Tax=Hyaloscypha variabilis (strain UAMH 11265 / GT02V1 / F) TaxID=1149755 RepID=A0A2J6RZW2_HYAVF|nr:hypothetical protein L207DRAFT_508816 [Hyaloscypha variabilis F]
MDNEVRVTLKALTSNVSPAERVFTLNPDRPSIPIGRASKSVSKGLLGAVDNAWFDSPVMSRDHAEMTIDVEEKKITIQDIGSMHGTYLNGVELPRKTPMAIDDGDILVFGAEVRRGPETFPACKFQVKYQFVPYKSRNTFTFPDSSDVEDEEAYDDFSEADMGEREQTSSDDGASIESLLAPLAKAPASSDPIDLTGDESPRVFASNRIDLTGETPLEQGLMDMMEGRPAEIPQNADPVSIGVYAGNNPILVDSEDEDEDAHFSIDSDDQSEVVEDEVSSDNESQDEAEESEEPSDEEEVDDLEDSDMGDAEQSSLLDPMDPPPNNSSTRFALATHDNTTVLLSDMRTRIEEPEGFAENDDESELDLSEAGNAGLRALCEEGLLRHDFERPYTMPTEAPAETAASSSYSTQVSKQISFASPSSMHTSQNNATNLGQNTNEYLRFQAAQSTIRHELKLSNPFGRQPSPSDAAMVKGRMPAPESTNIGVCDLGEFGKPTAQTLGEKTGKGDFFEAREFNKAKFGANSKSAQASGFSEMATPPFLGSFDETHPRLTTSTMNPFEGRVFGASQASNPSSGPSFGFGEALYPVNSHKATSAANKLSPADIIYFPTRDPCDFLDNPAHGPALDRALSPEPYMTSAVNFNAAAHKPRSGLGINDIINTASTTTKSLKRKADDISDVTDAELRIWAQSSTASSDDLNGSADASKPEEQASISSPMTGVVPTVHDNPAPAPRPTKRLKKLLENVGYAALGGVAVGAGLFSMLVATAPDFL